MDGCVQRISVGVHRLLSLFAVGHGNLCLPSLFCCSPTPPRSYLALPCLTSPATLTLASTSPRVRKQQRKQYEGPVTPHKTWFDVLAECSFGLMGGAGGGGAAEEAPTSTVVRIGNVVTPEELSDDEAQKEVCMHACILSTHPHGG